MGQTYARVRTPPPLLGNARILEAPDTEYPPYCNNNKHLRPMSVHPGALIIKGALAATFKVLLVAS